MVNESECGTHISRVLGRFVCSAVRFIPHKPRKTTGISPIVNSVIQDPFLDSLRKLKIQISTQTGTFSKFHVNHRACDMSNYRIIC